MAGSNIKACKVLQTTRGFPSFCWTLVASYCTGMSWQSAGAYWNCCRVGSRWKIKSRSYSFYIFVMLCNYIMLCKSEKTKAVRPTTGTRAKHPNSSFFPQTVYCWGSLFPFICLPSGCWGLALLMFLFPCLPWFVSQPGWWWPALRRVSSLVSLHLSPNLCHASRFLLSSY